MQVTNKQPQQPIILIYYRFKGMGQVARHLLCYLNIKFIDVHLDKYQEQKQKYQPYVSTRLKGERIDPQSLPVLLHGKYRCNELYSILAYICYAFNKQDLLGVSLNEKAKVQEIMQVYSNYLPHTQSLIFQFADNIALYPDDRIINFTIESYIKLLNLSQYIVPICEHIKRNQQKNKFVLGHLTIVDFYFFQTSNYILGLYGKIFQQNNQIQQKYIEYYKIMTQYHLLFKNLQSYKKNKKYIQNYPVIGCLMPPQRKNGFRKMWKLQSLQ